MNTNTIHYPSKDYLIYKQPKSMMNINFIFKKELRHFIYHIYSIIFQTIKNAIELSWWILLSKITNNTTFPYKRTKGPSQRFFNNCTLPNAFSMHPPILNWIHSFPPNLPICIAPSSSKTNKINLTPLTNQKKNQITKSQTHLARNCSF